MLKAKTLIKQLNSRHLSLWMSVARFHICHFAVIKDFIYSAWAKHCYFYFLLGSSQDGHRSKWKRRKMKAMSINQFLWWHFNALLVRLFQNDLKGSSHLPFPDFIFHRLQQATFLIGFHVPQGCTCSKEGTLGWALLSVVLLPAFLLSCLQV